MNTKLVAMIAVLTVFLGSFALIVPVRATTTCTFTTVGTTMILDGDCTTDATIPIPDGFTLDGAGHTITAVDPVGGHFVGAVVANAGLIAHVTNLVITTSGLANVCDSGDNRLRGIMFNGASGSITDNVVMNINQGSSGCQEGNAIEVRNYPFDGTHLNTMITVLVSGNTITAYQKTGIVANGDVYATITDNTVTGAGPIGYIAQNGIQVGFGGTGVVRGNTVTGNYYTGPECQLNPDGVCPEGLRTVSVGLLLYSVDPTLVKRSHNMLKDNQRPTLLYAL